jgi:hypothetical protein
MLSSVGARQARTGAITHEALNFVSKKHLGAELIDAPGGKLALRDATGRVVSEFDDLASASRSVYGALVDRGALSIGHLNATVQARSGFRLVSTGKPLVEEGSAAWKQATAEGRATKRQVFQLTSPMRRSDGSWTSKIADEDESLGRLLDRHPELDPRLPSTFAPTTYVVEGNKIAIESTVAVGPAAKLLEFANAFDSTMPTQIVASRIGRRLVKLSETRYRLVNDALGTTEDFAGKNAFTTASKALRENVDLWDEAYQSAAMKGFKLEANADGSLAVVGPQGVEATFSTLDEMRAWSAKTPTAPWIEDILGQDFAMAADTDVEIATLMETLRPAPRTAFGRAAQRAWSYFETYFGPSEMSAQEHAVLSGDTTIVRSIRQARNSLRIIDGAQARLGQLRAKVYEGANDKLLTKIAAATPWPEEVRAARWKSVFSEVMPEKAGEIIAKQRQYYDGLFRAYGMDAHKYVTNYLPVIRKFLLGNQDFLIDNNPATYLAQAAFKSGVPGEFALFAEKMRSSDLASMARMDNALEIAEAYSHAVLRAQYLNPLIGEVDATVKGLLEKSLNAKDKAEVMFLADTLNQLKGAPRSRSDSILAEAGQRVAITFTNVAKRIPILRKTIDPMATPDDVIGAINYRTTLATQATKTFAPIRNFFQINLLSAVFDSATPWKAARALLHDEPTLEALVRRMTRSGAVSERLPEEAMRADRTVWQRTMRWNENMDVFTRAVAWRSAEMRYDDAVKRLRTGTIELQAFARETKMHLLNAPEQETILAAVKASADDVGRDAYANAIQTLTMFDYTQMSKPMAARGFLGKLFGKFMTYPASTIALYGRLLKTGPVVDRLAAIARVAATSELTYQAFKAAGIDYTGFQWSDPFGFQGGPLWSILVDGTQIVGTDAQAKSSRTAILKSLPRILSPTYAFASQIAKSFAYLDQGDVVSAANALSGAPVRKDLALKFSLAPTVRGVFQAEPK